MIFVSDLDRTLIFSRKFTSDSPENYQQVEAGDYPSYMTRRAAELLNVIAEQMLFVPCTTRTVEQYLRLDFITGLQPQYAVVSNGGNLLINGKVDQQYQQELQLKLQDCLPAVDIMKEFNLITSPDWVLKTRVADGLFHYCIVDQRMIPEQDLTQFITWAATQNWDVSLQGRKLYLVPRVINKWAPIKKIMELTGESSVFTAGDSLLDLPLLVATPNHLSPRHGELYQHFKQKGHTREHKLTFTNNEGINAGEEILQHVIKWGKDRIILIKGEEEREA
ncbi:MAG: hypothetical protein FH758_10490 [Firmicutes bacterium]|nr:hypothetical protein [Bacillota bacterium]